MYMLLNHQKTRALPNGSTVSIGEDGSPYAYNGIIIVADGLGGRGGFPHSKLVPEALDESRFFDIAFDGLMPEADENFKGFVLSSFKELFELKDCYFDSYETKRTSGYFASRLATAIVLYELQHNEKLSKEFMFDQIRAAEDKEELVSKIGNYLAERIAPKLGRAADNLGLVNESKTKGSYLLPTTLVTAIVNEHEDEAEILCLWAGDSRCYLINDDGLAQLTCDHERDETMINLVNLTKEFTLEAKYLRVKKPFMLFNATDGCYKCGCFGSPIDLEYLFLTDLVASDSFKTLSKKLGGDFEAIGRHDDSNTMGLLTFGYETFEDVRRFAQNRVAYLDKTYKGRLDGIFDIDYVSELREVENVLQRSYIGLKDKILASPPLRRRITDSLIASSYKPYFDKKNELDAQKQAEESKLSEENDQIERWVRWYWANYPYLRNYYLGNDGNELFASIVESEQGMKRLEAEYANKVNGLYARLQTLFDKINGQKDTIKDYNACQKQFNDPNDQNGCTDRRNGFNATILELRNDLETLRSITENRRNACFDFDRIAEYKSALARQEKKFGSLKDRRGRIVREDQDAISAFVGKTLSEGKAFIDSFAFPSSVPEKFNYIRDYLEKIEKCNARKEEIDRQETALPEQMTEQYYDDNSRELIGYLFETEKELMKGLCGEMSESEAQQKRDELENCLKLRQQLYDEYETSYYREYKESKLL